MQRIGDLMDSALNNRQATNPFENARGITTRDIYPPTGILVKKGIKSIKIIWDPTPSNALLRYEVAFDNLTTGERTVKTTFINEVIFKATKGSYVARITSVSRGGSTSLVKTVQFNAGDEVMQLEGGKNGPLVLGTLVQDDIQHTSGYSMYVWGSVVLDKYVLANAVNPTATLRLWRAKGPDAVFNDPENPSTLQETIEMYPATESASNLDASSRGGLISRPTVYTKGSTGTQAGTAVSISRGGSFETSQSVMFSPIKVLASEDKDTFTYFLQAINRETDADEVNLSLTIWTGADGQGDAVPSDPFTPAPAYVFPNKNSFHNQIITWGVPSSNNPSLDARSMWATVPQALNLIGNQHTIAIWFKPDDLNAEEMGDPDTWDSGGARPLRLFSRVAMGSGGSIIRENRWSILITGLDSAGTDIHEIQISYDNLNGDNDRAFSAKSAAVIGSNKDVSGLFPWGSTAGSKPSAANNDAWYFMVICFEGGDFTNDSPSKLRVYLNKAANPSGGAPVMEFVDPTGVNGFDQSIEQDDTNTHGYSLGDSVTDGGSLPTNRNVANGIYAGNLRIPETQGDSFLHQIGIWNVALDRGTAAGSNSSLGTLVDVGLTNAGAEDEFIASSPIDYLFNAGFGTLVDWRQPSPLVTDLSQPTGLSRAYVQNENLVHLIQFGAVEQPMESGYPGRDTGNHYFTGDLNFTGTTHVGGFPQPWNYFGNDLNALPTTNNGEHWTDNTTIADVLSPEGTNGTTQHDECYPGQNL